MALLRKLLNKLKSISVDPESWGTDSSTPARSYNENSHLTNEELIRRIEERNSLGKPTYKLRLEYERRLRTSED